MTYMKDFKQDFKKLFKKFQNSENFAFSRFSDGELRIMENTELKLAGGYAKETHKHFIPSEHAFYREKLMDAYRFKKHNYYVGLSCRCCVGNKDFNQMLQWYEGDTSSEFLTWSNLMLNGNYPDYLRSFVPEYSNKKIVIICNENAKINKLPFSVEKDFRVGYNCFINNYSIIEEIKNWIDQNNISGYVFLLSASSLSNLLIHQLYKHCDTNTYIDIGTTLNHFLGIDGKRGYLTGRNRKICIW